MLTLSRLSPLNRLAALRRLPFWAQAAVVCVLFAIVGIAVLDDYGVGGDDIDQRRIASGNADYIVSGSDDRLYYRHHRYYGIAFEMPLLMVERALGMRDSRRIFLTRHLITHLFFIAGGFVCATLAYRMLGNRWIALFAMLLFLLHPRLYAHSFFNSKDTLFAVMIIIVLYLTHRAFRRDTFGAFLLCGMGVGVAINLRPFALILPPMILAMRGLDLWHAGREERKRILASAGIFAAAAVAIVYIIHPYYWENPLRFIDVFAGLSRHPTYIENLFMGEIYPPDAVPWNFIPVWFAITTPPVALALGALGAAAVCWQGVSRPLRALRDREIRFRILTLACFALPIVAVIALQTNIYNDWRHMYFLWVPFCLIAAVGLHTITNIRMGGGIWKIGARLPRRVRGGGLRRGLAYGAAGVGLITTATAMASLHPYEHVYFNSLVDTKTPGALAKRYDMDYWGVAHRQLLEHLLARYSDDTLRVSATNYAPQVLSSSDRERIVRTDARDADFYLNSNYHYRRDTPAPPMLHSIEAYGSVISFILAPNSGAYLDHYRAGYNDVAANGTPLARSAFDIYAYDDSLYYIRANCAPLPANANASVFLHIFPVDPADLPAASRQRGFENADFWIDEPASFFIHSAFFEGKCITQRPLPDYPIARIRTGHNAATGGGDDWRTDINLAARAAAQALYDGIAAGDYGPPAAQSDFDVYARGVVLAYVKENCAAGDADARFFLHIIPADPADLPAIWRERGFENLDFQFADHGARIDGKCVAERELPDYAIERIRTGQFVSGEGQLWGAEFAVGR